MEKEKPRFIKGCINNNIKRETATIIWDKMEKFCEYAFNKSHSTGYAYISAWTMWLKYYYPDIFFAALLNSFINLAKKTLDFSQEMNS